MFSFLPLLLLVVVKGQPFLPTQFCNDLPQGSYCNIFEPRQQIACPQSTITYCPVNQICTEFINGSISDTECVYDPNSMEYQKCLGLGNFGKLISVCLDDGTILECPGLNTFQCADDLKCQKRGGRAYCVPPIYQNTTKVENICDGFNTGGGEVSVCDPLNLRKIWKCPNGETRMCKGNQICSVVGDGVDCVPWLQDLSRFCSNKPLYSSYCIPKDPYKQMIVCSDRPQVLSCPQQQPKCIQKAGISATCA